MHSPEKKRFRIEDRSKFTDIPPVTSTGSPTAAAKELISVAVESQHEATKLVKRTRALAYLDLYETWLKRKATFERMSADGAIASSLRKMKFSLEGSKRIANTDAFLELQSKASEKLEAFKLDLMQDIAATVALDVAFIEEKFTDHIATSVKIVCDFEVARKVITPAEAPRYALYAAGCFTTCEWIDLDSLKKKILSVYNASDDPKIFELANIIANSPCGDCDIFSQVTTLFVDPIELHKRQIEFNRTSSELEQLALTFAYESEALKVDSILDTSMEDASTDMVKRVVDDKMSVDLKKINSRIDAINLKLKEPGGRPTPVQKNGRKSKQGNARSQDAHVNASGESNQKKKKKPPKKNSKN